MGDNSRHEARSFQGASQTLSRVLVVTRLLNLCLVLGAALFALGLLLHALSPAHAQAFWGIIVLMGLCVFAIGVWAASFNTQCDFTAAVLNEGWVRALTEFLGGWPRVPGSYALKHCELLSAFLAAKKHRIYLFVAPYIAAASGVLVVLTWFALTA